MSIIRSIVQGAKSFKREFKRELAAQKLAAGSIALSRQAAELDAMSPEQQKEYHDDVQAILARSAQIVKASRK